MVLLGIERLRERNFDVLAGKRIGLMSNAGTTDRMYRSTFEILRKAHGIDLRALFGPEHGFSASMPDATNVQHAIEPQTGLPIYSLYGDERQLTEDMLHDIDLVVCDIQDLGVRFYTYIWTISYILEACGKYGVDVLILDRPNPLGDCIDGAPLEPAFASFVGRFNIPQQHGMTVGELATLINQHWNPTPANLAVVTCYGWQRWMMWSHTGLPFVSPSPAIPDVETVYHYPGSCLIEGTQLSEGRGTALPFKVVGAPYIDGDQLAQILNQHRFDAVRFRPHAFVPDAGKFAGKICYGVQIHITDHCQYRPIRIWLETLLTIRDLYDTQFKWLAAEQSYYERSTGYHFDFLMGSDHVRKQIDAGSTFEELEKGWEDKWREFDVLRQPYLLYGNE